MNDIRIQRVVVKLVCKPLLLLTGYPNSLSRTLQFCLDRTCSPESQIAVLGLVRIFESVLPKLASG